MARRANHRDVMSKSAPGRFERPQAGPQDEIRMYFIIQDDDPKPGWDLILQRVLKIRSFPRHLAVNFPLFEQPVSIW